MQKPYNNDTSQDHAANDDKYQKLRDAAEMALNVLIGCVVAGDDVDDQRSMLEAQSMLRAALADGEASNGS